MWCPAGGNVSFSCHATVFEVIDLKGKGHMGLAIGLDFNHKDSCWGKEEDKVAKSSPELSKPDGTLDGLKLPNIWNIHCLDNI